MIDTPKHNGNWKALFVGPNIKIRRELTPFFTRHVAAFSGADVEGYPGLTQLADALRAHEPTLCFLDVSSDRNTALSLVPEILRVKPQLPVIAVLTQNDPDLILRCLRQGTTEFLLHPFSDDQVEGALQKLEKLMPGLGSGSQGKVYCVMPAKGGSGATTIASNLAYQLKRNGAKRILLADLDPLAGTMSFVLKLKSNYSFVDILQRAHDIDPDLWRAVATSRNGVDVLLSPENMVEGLSDLTDASPIVHNARAVYDLVVLDAGSIYGDWNLSQAQLCDELLLVATNELTSLQAVQRALAYLDANNVGRWKTRVVVNRYDKHVGLSREMIGTAIHTDIYHIVPSDYEAVQRALMDGKPVPSGTTLGKSIVGLADRLSGRDETSKKSTPLGGLMSLFSRTSS